MNPDLITLILSGLEVVDDLCVNELRADGVSGAVVPRGEELFPERETPRSSLLLSSLPPLLLLALRDGVQQVMPAAAQGPVLRGQQHTLASELQEGAQHAELSSTTGAVISPNLVAVGDVDRESERVLQTDFLRDGAAKL